MVYLLTFKHNQISEWVGECCLTPNEQFFSYIMTWISFIQWNDDDDGDDDDDDASFRLDQHSELDFYSASSLTQQSTGTHYSHSDSEPTSLCCYYLKLRS